MGGGPFTPHEVIHNILAVLEVLNQHLTESDSKHEELWYSAINRTQLNLDAAINKMIDLMKAEVGEE